MRKLSLILVLSLILSSMYIPVITKALSTDDYIYYNEFNSELSSEDKMVLKPVGTSPQDSVIVSPSDNALLFRGSGSDKWTASTSHIRLWLGEITNKPKLVYEIKFKGESFAGTANISYRTNNSESPLFFMNADKEIYDKSGGTLITTLSDVTTWHTIKIIFDNDKDTDGKYYRTILIDGVKYPNSKVEGNVYAETGEFRLSPSASLQTNPTVGDRKIYYDYIKVYEFSDDLTANFKAEESLRQVTASFSFDVIEDTLKKENITLISEEDQPHVVSVEDIKKESSTEYTFILSEKLKCDTLYNVSVPGVKSVMDIDLTGTFQIKTREPKLLLEDVLVSNSENVVTGEQMIDIHYTNETTSDFLGKLVYAQYKADGSLISVTDTDVINLLKEKASEKLSVDVNIDNNCDKMLIYILNSDGTSFSATYNLYKTNLREVTELIVPQNLTVHLASYSINETTGELTITVTADDDTTVTLTVEKGNETIYHNRVNTENMKADFKFTPTEDGQTYAYEYSVNGSSDKGNGEIVYYTPGYIQDQFDIFNNTEDTSVVDAFLTKFEENLNIDLDTYNGYSDKSGGKEIVQKSIIAQRKLIEPDKKYADYEEFKKALSKACDLASLKIGEKKIEDLKDYLDNDTFTYYKDNMTNRIKGFIESELLVREILTIPDLNTLLKDTLIFKAIEKGENYKITSGVIAKYHAYIGLDLEDYSDYLALKNSYAVDMAVHGTLYENFTLLNDAFSKAVENQKKKESSPAKPPVSSGGGGGGSPIGFSKPAETDQPVTPPTVEKPKSYFNDIEGFDWAKDAIEKLAYLGVVNGKADGIYAPGDTVTRAELVKMVISAFTIPSSTDKKEFNDVNADDWYYTYVNSAYDSGILKGIDESTFSPDGFVTREMAATVLYRVCNFKNIVLDASLKTFTDSENISSYAKEAVETLAGNSYINGYEDLTFKPQGNVTRAEIAVLINNLLK